MNRCRQCGVAAPPDGRFCIECGTELEQGTGATQRIDGPTCPDCGTPNPAIANFCVLCGRTLGNGEHQTAPQTQPLPRYAEPPPPRYANPPQPVVLTLPDAQPLAAPERARKRRYKGRMSNESGLLFLVGLLVLMFTGWWWPGILVLLGSVTLFQSLSENKLHEGLRPALWLLGIAVCAMFDLWWPGMLILVFLSMALDTQHGKFRKNC